MKRGGRDGPERGYHHRDEHRAQLNRVRGENGERNQPGRAGEQRPPREAQVQAHPERRGGRRGGDAQGSVPACASPAIRVHSTSPSAATSPIAFQ